jgi:hypothetical protein
MTTRTWHLYRKGDGRFTQSISLQDCEGIESHIKATTPVDYGAVEHIGSIDYESQRFDVESGAVVHFVPPAPEPAEDYEWLEDSRRWAMRAEVVEREAKVATALAEIERLEATQHRAFRELYLNPQDDEARSRVADIDTAIAEQRRVIRENGNERS